MFMVGRGNVVCYSKLPYGCGILYLFIAEYWFKCDFISLFEIQEEYFVSHKPYIELAYVPNVNTCHSASEIVS